MAYISALNPEEGLLVVWVLPSPVRSEWDCWPKYLQIQSTFNVRGHLKDRLFILVLQCLPLDALVTIDCHFLSPPPFLGSFVQITKSYFKVVMCTLPSVCIVCLHVSLKFGIRDFLRKSAENMQSWLKSDITEPLYLRTYIRLCCFL